MSSYSPPIEDVAIFDTALFKAGDEFITQSQADKRYLRFPNAQGTENLQAINVNGLATFSGTSNIVQQSGSQILQEPATSGYSSGGNVLNSTAMRYTNVGGFITGCEVIDAATNKTIRMVCNASNGAYEPIVTAGNNLISSTGPLCVCNEDANASNGIKFDTSQLLIGYGGSTNVPINNLTITSSGISVSGATTFNNNITCVGTSDIIQQSGSQILQAPASATNVSQNALNSTYITQSIANGPCLTLQDTITLSNLEYYGNTTAGYGNPIVSAGDSLLAFTNPNSSASTIARSGLTTNGLRLTDTTVSMGIGGTSSTPTNNIVVDGSNNITTFTGSSLSVQNNNVSFTSSTPPTSSQTIPAANDSSNKIPTTAWVQSAISAIVPTTQFVPKFVNYTDVQTTSSTGYSVGPRINFGGTWGINDICYFRIVSQISYNNTGSGYQNTGNTSGVLYFRPYYMYANWAPVSGTVVIYTQNTPGSPIMAADRSIAYYTPSYNIGNVGFFCLNGGDTNSVRVSVLSPQTTGGWEFFVSIEYLGSRSAAGTISFSDGTGTNAINNTLQ